MDERSILVLTLQKTGWTDNTKNIDQISRSGSYYKVLFNTGRECTYGLQKVQVYDQPQELDITNSVISIKTDNGSHSTWGSAIIFGPKICLFNRTFKRVESRENVEIKPNLACNPQVKALARYYRYIANLLQDKTPHLNYYYQKLLNIIPEQAILKQFIGAAQPGNSALPNPVIFPFGINPSQRQAVHNALTNQLSLIQGPPGTGKTQTILNIIANLVLQSKSVAVVAGNNSATDNVLEKLVKNQFGFIAARLGSKEQLTQFFTGDQSIPTVHPWRLSNQQRANIESELTQTSELIIQLLEARNQLAVTKEAVSALATERRHFELNFAVAPANLQNVSFFNRWHSRRLLQFMAEFEHYAQFDQLSWPTRFRWLWHYRIYRFDDLRRFSGDTLKAIAAEFYHKKSEELDEELAALQQLLQSNDFDTLLTRQTQYSLSIFKDHIARYYPSAKTHRFEQNTYKKDFESFLTRYPVVLSTADSIINNKSATALFDYLIVDEASQVNLLSGFLAMSSAKNMVVVGDLKQLPHIPDELIVKDHRTLDQQFQVQPGYSYLQESLLSSLNTIFGSTVPSTLLKEHYRCHPKIIDYCNQKFYDGQLVVMTESDNDPFTIIKTTKGNHARRPPKGGGWINERELDVIANEAIPTLHSNSSTQSLGVITPYRQQANKADIHLTNNALEVDTVHKYQGREKDTIIFGTTANGLNKFIDQPNVLNVAVSRAKSRFIMVTSQHVFKQQGSNIGDLIRHIEYQSLLPAIFESKVVSIFDCLYKEYADVMHVFMQKVQRKSRYLSEDLMATLLDELLLKEKYLSFSYHRNYRFALLNRDISQLSDRQQRFATHPNSHIDFLLFNKLDKQPVLAIEVDGYKYHQMNEKQKERDKQKASILQHLDIPLLRFSTIGSGEREKLNAALQALMSSVPDDLNDQG